MAIKHALFYCAASLLLPNLAYAELQALETDELEDVSGASGILIGLNAQATQDISYGPNGPDSEIFLLFGNSNIDIQYTDLSIDVVGGTQPAVRVGLPSNVSFSNFTTGILTASLDPLAGTSTPPPSLSDTPVTEQFQALVTNAWPEDRQGNLGENSYSLRIQDISTNAGGSLIGSGNLRILDWDDPAAELNTRLVICDSSGNNCGSGGTFNTPSATGFLGANVAQLESGYEFDTDFADNDWLPLVQTDNLEDFLSTSYTPTAFGSSVTNASRATRVLFSLDKLTTVRLEAELTDCYDGNLGGECAGPSPLDSPALSGDMEVLDPAVVLLDSDGNVLASDVSSGGPTGCLNGTDALCLNGTVLTTIARLEATIGDPFVSSADDVVLGGLTVGAPSEYLTPIVAEQVGQSTRGNIQFGGGISFFGRN